jgi:hypothetical protein
MLTATPSGTAINPRIDPLIKPLPDRRFQDPWNAIHQPGGLIQPSIKQF